MLLSAVSILVINRFTVFLSQERDPCLWLAVSVTEARSCWWRRRSILGPRSPHTPFEAEKVRVEVCSTQAAAQHWAIDRLSITSRLAVLSVNRSGSKRTRRRGTQLIRATNDRSLMMRSRMRVAASRKMGVAPRTHHALVAKPTVLWRLHQ